MQNLATFGWLAEWGVEVFAMATPHNHTTARQALGLWVRNRDTRGAGKGKVGNKVAPHSLKAALGCWTDAPQPASPGAACKAPSTKQGSHEAGHQAPQAPWAVSSNKTPH